jgi:hypothetical protein
MSEPVERLSRFTPDTGALDRDTLLFAAGRASARPNPRWVVLSSMLMVSQVLTLLLLLRPTPVPVSPAPEIESPRTVTPASSGEERPSWLVQRQLLESDNPGWPAPAADPKLVADSPPLRAFAGSAPVNLD